MLKIRDEYIETYNPERNQSVINELLNSQPAFYGVLTLKKFDIFNKSRTYRYFINQGKSIRCNKATLYLEENIPIFKEIAKITSNTVLTFYYQHTPEHFKIYAIDGFKLNLTEKQLTKLKTLIRTYWLQNPK